MRYAKLALGAAEMFHADKQYFQYLEGLSSFFYWGKDDEGCDTVERTEFGIDDIAFLDKDKKVLFFTTTHEGNANIAPELLDHDFR